jgi:hypothetical protein
MRMVVFLSVVLVCGYWPMPGGSLRPLILTARLRLIARVLSGGLGWMGGLCRRRSGTEELRERPPNVY